MRHLSIFISEALTLNKQTKVMDKVDDPYDPQYFNVGDILCGTWGYSMTIPAFYKIIKKTNKTFILKELEEKLVSGHYNGSWESVASDKEKRGEKEVKARINKNNHVYLKDKRLLLRLWDGKPIWGTDMD